MVDLLIKGGTVVDGDNGTSYVADVAISDGKIAEIGQLDGIEANCEIDAVNMIVCPGFVDNHSHGDLNALIDPRAEDKLLQGITTEIGGQCGVSLAPMGNEPDTMACRLIHFRSEDEKAALLKPMSFPQFMEKLAKTPMGPNVVCYMGQGVIRSYVMGYKEGEATPQQLEEMKQIVREGMEAGAAGLTTGLIYPTGNLTGTKELTELCKAIAPYNGIYCTHMRDEADHIIEALDEALYIARHSGARLIISHHKITGVDNVGLSEKTLSMIDQANLSGMDVYLDQYPYDAGATTLMSALPPQYVGDSRLLVQNLKDPAFRAKVKEDIESAKKGGLAAGAGGIAHVMIGGMDCHPSYVGRSPVEIGEDEGRDPYDVLFDAIIESDAEAKGIFFSISQDDMLRIMRHPRTMFGTDSPRATYFNTFGHPRAYGTFAQILTKYVRDDKIITLPEFVRRACTLPAQILGIKKGQIRKGYDADVLVLDLNHMKVLSSYTNSDGKNKGFRYVIVNGRIAVENDRCTGELAGKLVRIRHNELK